ncbi:MAG: DNA polymerase III subunit beta, partial [Bacteroidales bacterium]|nr:DNA polymerase III subunit beta [Bacteroidales bacterium]
MKFIISSSVLLKNLQLIYGVINPSNTLPILEDFLFELKEETLEITASDLETTMKVSMKTDKSEEPGIITIPAKLLLDTLKTLPDIPVTFSIDQETLIVEISTGEGKFKLSGHKSDEFPEVPVIEKASSITINSQILSSAIAQTIFATGNDDLRPVMSGVYCEIGPEDMTFVATDAHKLVRIKRKDIKSENQTSFILPKKPLNQLKNSLPESEDVTIEYDNTNAYFGFQNASLICRLIDGKYPNYEAVIPQNNPNKLIIDRNHFLNAIKRVSLYANQSTNQLRLKITGQELQLSAEDLDFSNEAKERLACNYEGEDLEIGFNSRFVQEMLNTLRSEQVRLEMSAPNRAGLLLPEDNKNENED